MFKTSFFIIALFGIISCKPVKVAGSEETTVISSQCLPSQSQCFIETTVGTFNITFSINPAHKKVITEVPFHIVVELVQSNDNTNKIMNLEGYLEGRDMFMGKIPAFFSQSKIKEKKAHVAEILLGSCSEDIMTWRLWLTVKLGEDNKPNSNQSKTFFIDFDSHKYL